MPALQKPSPTDSPVEIRLVDGSKDRTAFIRTGSVPYEDDPAYVTPLEFEIRQRLDPGANPTLKNAPHQLWIACKDGKPAGRISAMVNPLHLAQHKDETAHFGFLEAIDDPEVFSALLTVAEDWARARGMKKLAGPFNFSVNEETGMLVDGFDTPPFVMMPHGRPYYKDRIEALGYTKAHDMHALDWDNKLNFIPEKRKHFVEKTLDSPKVSIRNLDMNDFTGDIRRLVEIYNDAWSDNWGFIPFTEDQVRHMASELRPIISKHNVVFCYYEGEPAAFALALPNINEAIRDMNGKLLPFNWAKLIWRLKVRGLSTARMPLMGIRKKLQRRPIGAAFAYKMIEMTNTENMKRGLVYSETSWILESNKGMLSMLVDMGCRIYKTYRIYEKPL